MYCCNFLRKQSFLCNNYNICFLRSIFLIFHIQSCNISNNYIHFVQKQGMYSTYPVLYHIKHFSLVFKQSLIIVPFCNFVQFCLRICILKYHILNCFYKFCTKFCVVRRIKCNFTCFSIFAPHLHTVIHYVFFDAFIIKYSCTNRQTICRHPLYLIFFRQIEFDEIHCHFRILCIFANCKCLSCHICRC